VSRSLLEVLRTVSLDPSEHAAFSADPAGYLAQYGYEDVPAEDLAEAFSLVADTLPADVAQTVSTSFGAEATEADAGGFGAEAAIDSDGFAAGPSFDADATETTFGAVTNDFDDEADLGGADAPGDGDQLDDDADTLASLSQGPADDPDDLDGLDDGGFGAAYEADDAGFAFGEGSETLNGAYTGDAGPSETLDADDGLDLGFDDGVGSPDLGLGVTDPGLDDADFGAGLADGPEGADSAADLGLDDDLGFGSSAHGDADVDDIGAF
jgi:hypothetical protein